MNQLQFSSSPRLSDTQRIDWLQLIRSENVGPRTFRSLINHFGGAAAALQALPDLARRGGAAKPIQLYPRKDAEAEFTNAQRLGIQFVVPGEPGYPPHLHTIDDAPPMLAVRGNFATLALPAIGIVGSRNASAVGIKMAAQLANDLAHESFAIVSGLARGIDAAAHRSAPHLTIAVLAGGHTRIYPSEHVPLVDQIRAAGGATLSEMPIGWAPRGNDFPRRNRLISGVSLGVVIVEAAQRSGSLITARRAADQGREVFAVPGSPLDPRASGTNDLIKNGAMLVTEAADIINAVRPIMERPIDLPAYEPDESEQGERDFSYGPSASEPSPDDRSRIVGLLSPSPIAPDDLMRFADTTPAVIRIVLLELELAGRLQRHRDGKVSML